MLCSTVLDQDMFLALLVFLRDRKRTFEGGVGTYGGFVHIDTRGFNSDW